MASRPQWLNAVFVGTVYLTVGLAATALAGAAASTEVRSVWRIAAFAFSAVVFVVHVLHEHTRFRDSRRQTATLAAAAAALGAFGLAVIANLHDLGSALGYRPRMLVALAAWPLLGAVPAFIVAYMIATMLTARRAVR